MSAAAKQSEVSCFVTEPARQSIISTDVHCLTEFFREDVNLAVWQRKTDAKYAAFVETFVKQAGSLQRFVSIETGETADSILPDWASNLPGAADWLRDVNTVIDMFRCLFEPSAVGVRLHVLTGTMCPRFHVDRVPARLLLTYSGKGTEWLTEDQVIRGAEGTRLPDRGGSNSEGRTLGRKRRVRSGAQITRPGEYPASGAGAGLVVAGDYIHRTR
ncbi:Protein of unknown function [Thalassolituus maritimus]|uniref:Phytanoyl-CoA dioxygenase (PhyH) n=1 Tax=Thalassolituus maritimus TaxID=484498 RepID=A0A1N7QAP3_9GAMM|nr:DUF1826 domain-containing protein [Thalassolituus maritimus]SIT19925.1 Protein of unknown function [Thalassolituus maritimus]